MKYMLIVDCQADRDLVEEAICKDVESLREDGEAHNNRLADRLEALAFVPVPEATPNAPDQASDDPTALPLVAQLIEAGRAQTAATQQQVIAGLQRDLDRSQACLQLITASIQELCDQPWVPNPREIQAALYPTREQVERRAQLLWTARQ